MDRLSKLVNSSPFALAGSAMILVLVTIGVPFFTVWVAQLFKAMHVLHFVITYLVLLLAMFAIFLSVVSRSVQASIWRMLLFGVLFGYLSGIGGLALHLVIVPGGIERLVNSIRMASFTDYILVDIWFTTMLGLWVYGGIVGFTVWLLRRWSLHIDGQATA